MRSYQFNQSLHIAKRDYKRGVNQVSPEVEQDPAFLKYVSLGLIHDAEEAKIITPQTVKERSEKLLSRLMEQKKKAPSKTGAPPEPKTVDVAPSKTEAPPEPVHGHAHEKKADSDKHKKSPSAKN